MKTSIYHDGENNIDIEYYLHRSATPSNVLIVAFPAPFGQMRGGEWGYLITLRQIKDVSVLFIRSNNEYSKSRMTYRNGKPEIEHAIIALVNKAKNITESNKIVAIGSSMGGWCSLYYGIKYNWDIISGSPSYIFENKDDNLVYSMGEHNENNLLFMNKLLETVIGKYGEGYSKKCFVSWGEGESAWTNKIQGPAMLKKMESVGMKFEYDLYPFSDHLTICDLFPLILKKFLGYYFGLWNRPNKEEIFSSPQKELHDNIDNAYEESIKVIQEYLNHESNLIGCPCSNVPVYDNWDEFISLRNYVYIRSGWYWGVGSLSQPIDIRNLDIFLDEIPRVSGERNILEFAFHDSIMKYCEKDDDALCWLLDNISHYFSIKEKVERRFMSMVPYQHFNRMMFFLRLHQLVMSHGNLENESVKKIPHEILSCLHYIGESRNHGVPAFWAYRIILGILYAAVYFKRHKRLCETLYSAAIDLLYATIEYHFNKDGLCIRGQLYYHEVIALEISNVIEFVDENFLDSKKDVKLKRIKRKYMKILEFSSHISRPDGRISLIGHTSNMMRRTSGLIERVSSNLIRKSSNIIFLDDSSTSSYITVNGGQNTNSQYRHCDLLSFTWFYHGKQIFCDAGGGMKECEEYASSSIAHNAFICDDYDYVTPTHEDWTTIDNVDEKDDSVDIDMSHQLIPGVTMKRSVIWMKPNVIILIDDGVSDEEHSYTQNLLLENFQIDKTDIGRVIVQVDKEFYVVIKQHLIGDDVTLNEYRGSTEEDGKKQYRGALIENWNNLRSGLNLAYTKRGKGGVRFITSIECHCGSSKDKLLERSVDKVELINGKLCVKFC